MSSPVTVVIGPQAVRAPAVKTWAQHQGWDLSWWKWQDSLRVYWFYRCSFQCPWNLLTGHTAVIFSCGFAQTQHLATFGIRVWYHYRSSSYRIFTVIPVPIYDSTLSVAIQSQFYCTAVETWARLHTVIWIRGQISSLLCRKPKNRWFMFGDCVGFPSIVARFLWDCP
jgi:hypothetical protein